MALCGVTMSRATTNNISFAPFLQEKKEHKFKKNVFCSYICSQVKDRVEYYSSTPVTVNVRVTMNDTLRFPILTVCNKNSFNMSRIRILQTEMTGSNVTQLQVNISHLVGLRGMDAKQLWDIIAHDPDQLIAEVTTSCHTPFYVIDLIVDWWHAPISCSQ